jgi:hypothetical protein
MPTKSAALLRLRRLCGTLDFPHDLLYPISPSRVVFLLLKTRFNYFPSKKMDGP